MPECTKYTQTHLLSPHPNLFLFLSTYAFCLFFPLELILSPSTHSACSSFNLKWQKHDIAITVFATFTRATLTCPMLVYFSYAIVSQTSLTRNTFSVQCVYMYICVCTRTLTHTNTYTCTHTLKNAYFYYVQSIFTILFLKWSSWPKTDFTNHWWVMTNSLKNIELGWWCW